MKKLIFVFVALFMVVLISGCGARQNTVRFDGNSNTNTEESTESTDVEDVEDSEASESLDETEDAMEDLDKTEVKSNAKLAVTSFDGAFLETNLSYNLVKGTVPTGTHMVKVNDYKLQKYIPGQTEFDYIASTRFGTLNAGLNNYVLKSYDKSGDQTGSIMFSIDYTAPIIPDELPDVGASHWLALLATLVTLGTYAIFRRYKWL